MVSNRLTVRSAVINVMIGAVQKAGRALVRDFGELEHLQVSRKQLGDFVSSADHRSEQILIEELQKARPTYGFLLEESGVIEAQEIENQGKDPHRWLIDPLDGTTNFLHGIPYFAVSVGLQKEQEVIAGVIYNPITDELFWVEKGKGSFLNQRRIRVSGRRYLNESLIGMGTPFRPHTDKKAFTETLERLLPQSAGLRRNGAAALDLAYVAAGRFDGYFASHLSPWDLAAGLLMVKEAGGYVSDFQGGQNILETGAIIAANDQIFGQLSTVLQS